MKKSVLALAILLASSTVYAERNFQGIGLNYDDTGTRYISSVSVAYDMDDIFSFQIGTSKTNYSDLSTAQFHTKEVYGTFTPHTAISDRTSLYGTVGMARVSMVENGETILTATRTITKIGVKYDLNEFITTGAELAYSLVDEYCSTDDCYTAEPDDDLSNTIVKFDMTVGNRLQATLSVIQDLNNDNSWFGGVGMGVGMRYTF